MRKEKMQLAQEDNQEHHGKKKKAPAGAMA
jgi:hypothetical protein